VNKLSQCRGGITINNGYFYVFCQSDDLTEVANKYITEHGLRLNPSKPECTIFGNCNLDPDHEWMLNGVKLKESDGVNYLGISLCHAKPNLHFDNRINACRRAYYALQGAGFNNNNSDIDTLSFVWKAAVRPVLMYCCNSMYISKESLSNMKKLEVCTNTAKVHMF
jgi:hypothetical protein